MDATCRSTAPSCLHPKLVHVSIAPGRYSTHKGLGCMHLPQPAVDVAGHVELLTPKSPYRRAAALADSRRAMQT